MGGGGLGVAFTFLFIGLGAGALIGVLMAPKTGKQMRRSLRRRYEDAREAVGDLGDQAGDVLERGAGYANAVRERVEPIGRVINKKRW
jgi:gas vesicle protein